MSWVAAQATPSSRRRRPPRSTPIRSRSVMVRRPYYDFAPSARGRAAPSSARSAPTMGRSGGATPAAALTGFTGPEHRASILRAGFQYHVEKPVTLQQLAGVVALLALKPQSPF